MRTERWLDRDTPPTLDLIEGKAWRRLGNTGRARAAFQKAYDRDASLHEAADSLAAMDLHGGDTR